MEILVSTLKSNGSFLFRLLIVAYIPAVECVFLRITLWSIVPWNKYFYSRVILSLFFLGGNISSVHLSVAVRLLIGTLYGRVTSLWTLMSVCWFVGQSDDLSKFPQNKGKYLFEYCLPMNLLTKSESSYLKLKIDYKEL